jgi:hypothetical protein
MSRIFISCRTMFPSILRGLLQVLNLISQSKKPFAFYMGFKALVTTHDGNCFEKQLTNLQKIPIKKVTHAQTNIPQTLTPSKHASQPNIAQTLH